MRGIYKYTTNPDTAPIAGAAVSGAPLLGVNALTTSAIAAVATGTVIDVGSVEAARLQTIRLASLFTVPASAATPAYMIVSVLDRNEYTAGFNPIDTGLLSGNGTTLALSSSGTDPWTAGIVFTYQASTNSYVNATYGPLNALTFTTGTNLGDTATISLYGCSNATLATGWAAQPYVLVYNPTYFSYQGSVTVLTQATAAAVPSQATPASIAAAAQSYVGDVWNMNGCWVLASDIAAKAGTSLPATSPLVGITGISNGEWIVAYDGTLTPNANWANSVTTGEMVSFITASGTGHITTVVSGSGAADRQHHLPLSERPGRQQRQ